MVKIQGEEVTVAKRLRLNWPLNTVAFKIRASLATVFMLSTLPAFGAIYLLDNAAAFERQANFAHEVLNRHLELTEAGHRAVQHHKHELPFDEDRSRAARSEVDKIALDLRKKIANEVAIRGEGGIEEEGEELDRIDAIMTSLNSALSGADNDDWTRLIAQAVAHEREEVAEIDAKEERALKAGASLLMVSAVAATILMLLMLAWLNRALLEPLRLLLDTTAKIANGQLDARASPMVDREFNDIATSLNVMAVRLDQRESALRDDAEQLEELVRKRTEELASVNETLTENSDRRVQFLTDISHELRTPLAVILGDAEVTLRGADKPLVEYKSTLGRIAGQVGNLTRLVDDLLYVARNESGAPKFKLRPVNLATIAEEATAALRPLIEDDDGSITVSSDGEAAMIMGDKVRLSQLLHILLDNAVHYSDGPPAIEVTLIRSVDGVKCLVADQGIGIAQSELVGIFERFHRGSNGNEKNESGLGIGLPMAKAIVEAHGGSITIESELGQGTTVSVFVPAAQKLRLTNEYIGG